MEGTWRQGWTYIGTAGQGGSQGWGQHREGGNRWMWGQGCRAHRSVGEQGDTRDHGTGTLLE